MKFAATFLLSIAAASPAQTFVVDASGGPGTAYTSLATATAAVPDGAVLVVRPGSYPPPVVIQGKSLTVLCDAGVQVHSQPGNPTSLTIDAIAAGQSVVVRGLQLFSPDSQSQTRVLCTNSAGLILLDNVKPSPLNIGRNDFDATGCTTLCLRDCAVRSQATVTSCQMTMVRCTIPAPSAGGVLLNGIVQFGGALHLVDCSVRGSYSSVVTVPGGPAVSLNGGSLRLLGTTTLTGGSFLFGLPSGYAVAGAGHVRRDPSTSLITNGFPHPPAVSMATTPMPHVTVQDVLPTGTAVGSLHGPHGHGAFLFVGPTGPTLPVPLLADPAWIDPAGMLLLAAGVPGPGAPVTASIFVPGVSTALGFKFVWQGLTFDAAAGFQSSNPDYTVVD